VLHPLISGKVTFFHFVFPFLLEIISKLIQKETEKSAMIFKNF